MNILINAFGVSNSGGVIVLEKISDEFSLNNKNNYIYICNNSKDILRLVNKYKSQDNFQFQILPNRNLLYRMYFENFIFKKIIKRHSIDLIYNFSGTRQLFIKTPQLNKVHNLLYYSKKLDNLYKLKYKYILWIKHIFLKRLVFKFMLNRSEFVEIQSSHVKSCLLDFKVTGERQFYLKSDNDVSCRAFQAPKSYDFSKKIKFLYVVGPHFEHLHKNMEDFTKAMLALNDKGINFEINITLTSSQLCNSKVWDTSLNSKTNFIGYVNSKKAMMDLFCDNTILISTSVIETLGLHVIDGIKNGIIIIAPDEKYANSVYGDKIFKYSLFNKDSLMSVIMDIINYKSAHGEKILSIQKQLRQSESSKFRSILDVFDEVVNVQK
tara:strand:- start:1446 stop:2585 length:1140 start_codon:yes stop_codon:yes gene_type:complete